MWVLIFIMNATAGQCRVIGGMGWDVECSKRVKGKVQKSECMKVGLDPDIVALERSQTEGVVERAEGIDVLMLA